METDRENTTLKSIMRSGNGSPALSSQYQPIKIQQQNIVPSTKIKAKRNSSILDIQTNANGLLTNSFDQKLGDNVIYNPFVDKSVAYNEDMVNKLIYAQGLNQRYSINGSKLSTKVPFSNSVDFRESHLSTPLGSAYKTSGKIEIKDLCNPQNCNYRID